LIFVAFHYFILIIVIVLKYLILLF